LALSLAISYYKINEIEAKKQLCDKNKFLFNVINSFAEPLYVLCPESKIVHLANKAANNYAIREGELFENNTIITEPGDKKKFTELRNKIVKTETNQRI
jgi:hypothetical protein